jgi:outer membrane biogenesis lipoprotein LolB
MQKMKNHLSIALEPFAALLLAGCSTKDAPGPAASQGAQAGQRTRLKAKSHETDHYGNRSVDDFCSERRRIEMTAHALSQQAIQDGMKPAKHADQLNLKGVLK